MNPTHQPRKNSKFQNHQTYLIYLQFPLLWVIPSSFKKKSAEPRFISQTLAFAQKHLGLCSLNRHCPNCRQFAPYQYLPRDISECFQVYVESVLEARTAELLTRSTCLHVSSKEPPVATSAGKLVNRLPAIHSDGSIVGVARRLAFQRRMRDDLLRRHCPRLSTDFLGSRERYTAPPLRSSSPPIT